MSRNLCLVQARLGSTRLPGKVLKSVGKTTILGYQIKRLKLAKLINKIVVATGDDHGNDHLAAYCRQIKILCFRGSEADVLTRFYRCARAFPAYPNIIRVTGDCPLIDPAVVDQVINLFNKSRAAYGTNTLPPTYPDGMDIEIFTRAALAEAYRQANLLSEREHVTPYLRKNKKIKKVNLCAPANFSHFRLTVDNQDDFDVIKFLINNSRPDATYLDYIALLTKHPQIMFKNSHLTRNEGHLKSLKNDKKIKIKKES